MRFFGLVGCVVLVMIDWLGDNNEVEKKMKLEQECCST